MVNMPIRDEDPVVRVSMVRGERNQEASQALNFWGKEETYLFGVPALRTEGEGVGAVDVSSSVQGPDGVDDDLVFLDVDWGEAVWTSAAGDSGVFVGEASVTWDDWVKAEGWFC